MATDCCSCAEKVFATCCLLTGMQYTYHLLCRAVAERNCRLACSEGKPAYDVLAASILPPSIELC